MTAPCFIPWAITHHIPAYFYCKNLPVKEDIQILARILGQCSGGSSDLGLPMVSLILRHFDGQKLSEMISFLFHEQTVTIVTATVATTTVQSTSNTTKTVVKQRGEKLANLQRMTGGSVPCCRVQVGGPVKQQSGPAAIMTAGSGRSSVSSLASSSAGTSSSSCCCNGANANGIPQLQHQQSLNQALAIVANKWDREQRIQDQETTRRLTLLKQRKISAILKVRIKIRIVLLLD